MYPRPNRLRGNRFTAPGFLLVCLSGLLVSCSAIQGKKLLKSGYVKPGHSTVTLSPAPTDSITLHYWGCGGFYIQYGNEAVLIDPFATNPALGADIRTDTTAVDRLMQHATGLNKGQSLPVTAVLCTHAHYDHLMDTPYIMQHWLQNKALFAGNRTANIIMWAARSSAPLLNLDAQNGFFHAGKHIRITPVLLSHPPHIGKLKLYGGEFEPKAKPHQAKFWQCGQTYGFIMDFLDNGGRIVFRIYQQTSSGLLGLDNVPASVAAQHPVDLMIIPAALYSKVEGYPEQLLDRYRPKHVLVCHWENFFKPMETISQKPYTISLTNVPKFAQRLEKQVGRSHFTIPMPDSRFVVKF